MPSNGDKAQIIRRRFTTFTKSNLVIKKRGDKCLHVFFISYSFVKQIYKTVFVSVVRGR
jgi:hypothetical protein